MCQWRGFPPIHDFTARIGRMQARLDCAISNRVKFLAHRAGFFIYMGEMRAKNPIQVNPGQVVGETEYAAILLTLQDLLDHRDRIQSRIEELTHKLSAFNKAHQLQSARDAPKG